MSRFLATRSCNDDYVPFRVTREANIEYVMNDNNTTDANMFFRKKEDMLKAPFELQFDLQFEDPRLAAIDVRLEHIYAMEEARFNNDGDGLVEERPPFDDETQHIFAFSLRHLISIADAVDYLKSCHYCGNTNIPFASEYCNDSCQNFATKLCYPCFRKDECKVCDNYWIYNSYVDEYYEEFSLSDRNFDDDDEYDW